MLRAHYKGKAEELKSITGPLFFMSPGVYWYYFIGLGGTFNLSDWLMLGLYYGQIALWLWWVGWGARSHATVEEASAIRRARGLSAGLGGYEQG